MRENYKRLGDYIELIDERNKDLSVDRLLGLTIDKKFIPSVANTVGTNMKRYKIIRKNQFACSIMQVRRDKKMPIAILKEFDEAIISQAYPVFKVKDEEVLLPDYLMMWFSRAEFDRQATFHAVGGVRGSVEWDDFMDFELPIPSIEKQRAIVAEYQSVENKIKTNEQICEKLEATAQALYKHWFVDLNEDDIEFVRLDNYIETNPRLSLNRGQVANYTEMKDVSENKLSVTSPIKRKYRGGSRFQNNDTLFARITPCLENGKTGFVDYLENGEIGFGSTEFIVVRPKKDISPFWVYCLCKDERFRTYAISSMVGSSGRQRVHESYLLEYEIAEINKDKMENFHNLIKPVFNTIKIKNLANQKLSQLQDLLLSRMAGVDKDKELKRN